MAALVTRYGRVAEPPIDLSPRWLDLVGHREHVASAATDCDAILGALDIILHGYPVGASSFGRGS